MLSTVRHSKASLLALLLAVIVTAAACGGSDAEPAVAAAEPVEETAETASDDEPAAVDSEPEPEPELEPEPEPEPEAEAEPEPEPEPEAADGTTTSPSDDSEPLTAGGTDDDVEITALLRDFLGIEGAELEAGTQCVLAQFDAAGLTPADDESGAQSFLAAAQCDLMGDEVFAGIASTASVEADVASCGQAATKAFFRELDLSDWEVLDSDDMPAVLQDALLECGYSEDEINS